jgi:AAA+ ATPase superfamily predicted ATPase
VINASYTKLEKIKDAARDFFSLLRPKLIISTDGKVTLDLSAEKTFKEEELVEIFDFPEKVAQARKRRMIMIFDEFQEITMMNGLGIEKLMRSRFQHHRNVSYVFAGSKEHILHQMFEEKTRAFFKFARPLSLGMIPKDDFSPFISKKFKMTGGSASDEIIDKVLTYTKGHPYFTQYLCHEIWYITKSPKEEDVVDTALQNIIAQQSIAYEHIWDELRSRNQRALLIGIACEGEHNYSLDFIERYGLKSQSRVEKSLQMLKNRGVLDDNGQIIDLFFKEWVIRRTRQE